MKKFIKWALIALTEIIIIAVVGIILCRTVFKESIIKFYNEDLYEERVELLRATEYKPSNDSITFNHRPDSVFASKIVDYFRLDSIVDKYPDTWNRAIAVAKIVCANIPHENQETEPIDKTSIGLWQYSKTLNS